MDVYFDNAATTKILPEAEEIMFKTLRENYANPSSATVIGLEADRIIKNSAVTIANFINAESSDIYFTSGGTESDNWAIFGTAKACRGRHSITTKTEHPAVNMPLEELKAQGFDIDKLDVDQNGYISIEELKSKIRKDTILVSIIFVNNETGVIQDIENIGKAIKDVNPLTFFHVDAVQGFGKHNIDVKKCRIALLSASGHKFGAPRGTGFLYVKNGINLKPIIFGGGQQKGKRAGTENVAGAASMAAAAEYCYKNIENNLINVQAIKDYISQRVLTDIEDTFVNGDINASPYVLNMGFRGVKSEVLLHALESERIFVSAGSACNSRKKIRSSVLLAMGKSDSDIDCSIRFSFSAFNTIKEAEYCVALLKNKVDFLRKFSNVR